MLRLESGLFGWNVANSEIFEECLSKKDHLSNEVLEIMVKIQRGRLYNFDTDIFWKSIKIGFLLSF